MSHFRTICVCGTLIAQCRCPSNNKTETIISPCNHKRDLPYLVTTEWSDELQSVVGKFEVSPTPQAQQLWEIVKTRPDMYEFGISYTEDPETGKKELLGLSLIMKPPCNEK